MAAFIESGQERMGRKDAKEMQNAKFVCGSIEKCRIFCTFIKNGI